MSEPGSATETEEKPVDGKYGQPLRSRLQKDQILTKESTKGNKNLDIGATISESQPSHPYAGTSNSGLRQAQAPVKTVMLNTRLRYGRISNRRDDILYWEPGWVIPDYIEKDLFRKHSKTSDAELVILSDEKDMLICQVNEKKSSSHQIQPEGFQHPHLAPGEMIKLKTRMYCGHISFDAKDVEIFAKSWRVPEELSSTLLKEYWTTPNANLLIVSDSKGNVREKAWRRDEKPNVEPREIQLAMKRLQQQVDNKIRVLSEKRKANEENRQHEEHLREMQRTELEEEKRRQENLKRLQLEAELCRRRDELFNYRFREKTRLDWSTN
ncbi:hypothetical protein ACROYT_G027465 [Oculina patagonica]